MPTHDETEEFLAGWDRLTDAEQRAFRRAVRKLVADLATGDLRKGLRIKRYWGLPGAWEMTWADDGRALFRYGPSIRPGDPHVVWIRVGSHDIFARAIASAASGFNPLRF